MWLPKQGEMRRRWESSWRKEVNQILTRTNRHAYHNNVNTKKYGIGWAQSTIDVHTQKHEAVNGKLKKSNSHHPWNSNSSTWYPSICIILWHHPMTSDICCLALFDPLVSTGKHRNLTSDAIKDNKQQESHPALAMSQCARVLMGVSHKSRECVAAKQVKS